MNQNSKCPRFWTPRLTTITQPSNSSTLSTGQDTKALMKKPLGFSPPNSDMLQNWSLTFTQHTLPNLAPCQNSDSSVLTLGTHTICSMTSYSIYLQDKLQTSL